MEKPKIKALIVVKFISLTIFLLFQVEGIAQADTFDVWKDLWSEYIDDNQSILNTYGIEKARRLSRGHPVTWSSASTDFNIRDSLLILGLKGRVNTSVGSCRIKLSLKFFANDNDNRIYPIYFTFSSHHVDVSGCKGLSVVACTVVVDCEKKAKREINRGLKKEKEGMVAEINLKADQISQDISAKYGND